MPLVLLAVIAYAAGLLLGFGGALVFALAVGAGAGLLGTARGDLRLAALALVVVAGAGAAVLATRESARCTGAVAGADSLTATIEDDAGPGAAVRATLHAGGCAMPARLLVERGDARGGAVVRLTGRVTSSDGRVMVQRARLRDTGARGTLASLRARARRTIQARFGADAPLVLALLVADTRDIPSETRDRFAASGLVHVLSVSGLHVSIIARSALLLLAAARLSRRGARVAALALTAAYVVLLGLPAPAVRAATMLAVMDASHLAQRPTSPWAALALGAAAPLLLDAHAVADVGWQLSIAGMAALLASGALVRRIVAPRLSGWRLTVAGELVASTVATLVTAPIVAGTFGQVSLAGPLANLFASPIVALLQPTLFLAVLLEPIAPVAGIVASAAHPMLAALDGVAALFAAVPGAAVGVAPTATGALLAGLAAASLVVACASRAPARALVAGTAVLAMAAWLPFVPRAASPMELHMIDVGQGDALALRTPRGRWLLFDAGRAWRGGDAGRTTIVPYLRRRGGRLVAFVLSHPHTDHVGGAATVLAALRPEAYYDAAFAGDATAYRESLERARALGTAWHRVHPGDSLVVDGVVVSFLAPDSAWTAALDDPNLASTVVRVRFGLVRILLTGDAELPEEGWLLAHAGAALRADVLKAGHHGSATSSGEAFLDAVRPRVALVSVGLGNGYGHPGRDVLARLARRGAQVLRTDELGTVIVRTDGRDLELEAWGTRWPVPRDSSPP